MRVSSSCCLRSLPRRRKKEIFPCVRFQRRMGGRGSDTAVGCVLLCAAVFIMEILHGTMARFAFGACVGCFVD